jgi:hypothetical protein
MTLHPVFNSFRHGIVVHGLAPIDVQKGHFFCHLFLSVVSTLKVIGVILPERLVINNNIVYSVKAGMIDLRLRIQVLN